MSELLAVRCAACGGTVRMVAGRAMPSCVFCGADAKDLVPTEPPEGIEPPIGGLPFAVSDAQARAAFERFTASSIWYPSDLRSARLELVRLMVPAWAWSGEVETHWTGLVRASTRSRKRPVAGADRARFDQILVPASSALRQSELSALGAYDESSLAALVGEDAAMELGELTRSAARQQAQQEMEARHRAAIVRDQGLISVRASSVATGLEGRPVLVPVWIGAYRYGERPFRVLVHGQTGRLVGDAPFSVYKIAGAVAAGIGIVVALVVIFALIASSS